MKAYTAKTRLAGAAAALAATTALLGAPVASAGTPIGPGGCNMLTPDFTQSPIGTTQMMAGSSGSHEGNGAANMLAIFPRFSDASFCGAYS
jgi:hypothetical protein